MTHEVKSRTDVFQKRWDGQKPWEFRKNDRGYEEGHHLHEREVDLKGSYTGRHILSRITYLLGTEGEEFGIPRGFCIMTVEQVARGLWLPRPQERKP